MTTKNGYLIPASTVRVEEKIKKSRFIATIAHASSVSEAKEFIQKIKKEFPDASHNCWAYQTGPPGETLSIGMSDDGEPHNTAGRPMLDILKHCKIGEIVAVVTRYFGGIKLGTGGLVRAYSGVLKKALDSAELKEKKDMENISFTISYENINAVKNILKKFDAEILEEIYKENVFLAISVYKEKSDELKIMVGMNALIIF